MNVQVYLNHGRWVIDCPVCNSGLMAKDSFMVCVACYPNLMSKHESSRLRAVKVATMQGNLLELNWPDNKYEIDEVVKDRPVVNQNWKPNEGNTMESMRAENAAHGVA